MKKELLVLIITGTGRSGTATMARLFSGFHEFRADYILEKYFINAEPGSELFETLEARVKVILDLHQGIDEQKFVDSSNLYIHFIDALYLLNPGMKMILTVRNGKDFVRSAYSRRWHEQNVFGTVPPRTDKYFGQWNSLSPIQKNAWIWTWRNRTALEGLRVLPRGQKFILRIEDLQKYETLNLLEAFAGKFHRKVAEKRHNANPDFSLLEKEKWTGLQEKEFNSIAGEMMDFFGYD
jgi:hypothetical protein